MRRPRVIWDKSVPRALRALCKPHVEQHVYLLPGWCEEIRIGYDADSEGASANVRVAQEYRFARITLHPPMIDMSEADRADTIRHEILHVATMPMVVLLHKAMNALELESANPPLHAWIVESARETMESVVQDLTESLLRGGKS